MAPPPPLAAGARIPRRPNVDDTRHPRPQRSHSFRTRAAAPSSSHTLRRPKTQPNLISAAAAASGGGGFSPPPRPLAGEGAMVRRVPAKVLVSVTVQRSLGPVQVMASTEWSVAELAAAAVKFYVKEGRRPQLPTTDPAAFGLHYSQFSFDCLDPQEKLMELGSRNFFLCPKSVSSATAEAAPASSSCSGEVQSKMPVNWLRFIVFVM